MTTYSHSRLGTYENCPLQYKYRYVKRIDIDRRDSVEAFLGSRCHESLEKMYKLLLNARMWSKDELLDDYKLRWEREWHDNIFIVRTDLRPGDYYNQGLKALSDYYDRYRPFDRDKTLALEQRVEVALDDSGKYRLQGFIDRLSETDEGHYQIHDYKTERTWKTQEYFDAERQLALYQIGISNMFSDIRSVELIWHYLIFDKEARSSRTGRQLEELKLKTIHLIQEIEDATEKDDFTYIESALCDWCDYYHICPAKKHVHLTEMMSPREFAEDEGVQMVNRYIEVKDALAELKAEKEQIERNLFEFCKQLSVEVVRGSTHKVKVKSEPSYKAKFTASDDPAEKERFLQFIKERGLYDELMIIHYQKLNSAIKGTQLSPDIRQALLDFVYLEEGKPRFSASKLRKSDY
ncbi:MAG TPA: PD-(D/E)XK nuclease family protein [candidate division Zixibacteria bacterium]|nr:PD-(D/E)XK nuclease family protein [candidate division Zixibacteria bacterium]